MILCFITCLLQFWNNSNIVLKLENIFMPRVFFKVEEGCICDSFCAYFSHQLGGHLIIFLVGFTN
jgi:hypothetical protein